MSRAVTLARAVSLSILLVLPGCQDDQTSNGAPPAAPAPVTAPAVTAPLPTAPPPLSLTCTADPRSGSVPLAVTFRAFPTGGTGTYDFLWQFGDGERSTQVHPSHTYTAAGVFDTSVTVTSGDQVRGCERSVRVEGAPAGPTPPAPGGSPVPLPDLVITIVGNSGASSYSPSLADARVGQRVVWRNADFIFHTATANGGAFDTGFLAPGASRSIVTATPGTFPYHCTIHPGMVATLRVAP